MQYKFILILHTQMQRKKSNIIKWPQKIMKIKHTSFHHDHCLHKKFEVKAQFDCHLDSKS